MISPQDDEYRQTKLIKKADAQLGSPFRELADQVSVNFGVRVLNVIYDTVIPNERPRLNVVLDTIDDALKFRDGPHGRFLESKQKQVGDILLAILSQRPDLSFNVEGMFVIFTCFEQVAREEANENVTEEEISRLMADLNNSALWKISRCFDSVTFLFYTEAQVTQFKADGLGEKYFREYSRLVQSHDEFGYLRNRGVAVYFDSKENFDANFKGNWMNYYR